MDDLTFFLSFFFSSIFSLLSFSAHFLLVFCSRSLARCSCSLLSLYFNHSDVIDLALAVILGGAFSAIVSSFVTDIITPLISLAVPKGGNLADQFIVLRAGKSGNESYASLTIAKADGSITWNWGAFVNAVIYFVIVAALMFLMLKLVFGLLWRKKEAEPTTKACEVCKEDVKIGALKCPHCHTPVPQEEEEENEKDV